MAGVNFSDVETFGNLKEMYADDAQFQERLQHSLWNFIDRAGSDEVNFDGKSFSKGIYLQHNESYAGLNDDEELPVSGQMKKVFAKFKPKLSYSSMEGTHFALTRGHKNGRVDGKYIDDLVSSTLISFMANLDSDCYGNGRGFRATVATAVAGAASFTVESSMRLRPGMVLDWYDATYAVKRGTIEIALKGVDRMTRKPFIDAAKFTGAVPAGAVAGDKLVVANALKAGEPADGRFCMGLKRLTDNSLAIGELSPADYAQWLSTNQSAGFGNISQEILQMQFDIMFGISGMYPDRLAFNPVQKRSYLAGFLNQRRFNSNNFDGGATSLSFSPVKMGEDDGNKKPSGFKMLEDHKCDPETIFTWHSSAFKIATEYASEPHIADEDGTEWRKKAGYDAEMAFYRFWFNTVCFQRNATGSITDLAVGSGVL